MLLPPFTAFDGKLYVHYGQAYILSPECDMLTPEDAFTQQRNGLCGAAVAGGMFLTTGLHTGHVNFRVLVHHLAPPIDDSWDEVVEAPWSVGSAPVMLQDWNGAEMCEIPLESGDYRVRYSARRFGEAEEDDDENGLDPVESYLLEFWPALRTDDAVLKQTSAHAAYWHGDSSWPTMKR